MKVIYPGSFDPVTLGHLDIIERCASKFNHLIIAVLNNSAKKGAFSINERIHLLRETTKHLKNVEIDSFDGLLTDYAKKRECFTLIRGLRAISDFENEMQMALVNRKIGNDIETIFMVSRSEYVYLSSSIVKEIASYGGSISCFVPKIVEDALYKINKGGI